MSLLLPLFCNLFFAVQYNLGHGDSTLANNQFLSATRLLQANKYDEAYSEFESEHSTGSDNPTLLYNWGLAAYHKKKLGMATALWRRALFFDPEMTSARQALEFIERELPQGMGLDTTSLWKSFNINILSRVTLNKLFALLWLFFVSSTGLLIRYGGRRKRALHNNTSAPHLPTVGIGFSVLFVLFLFLTVTKSFSLLEVRATVIAASSVLRTGPSPDDNSIFDLVEGLDVAVRKVQNTWVLIALPTGLSGWVQSEALFQHTGKAKAW